jgi:rhodanese-related sulfurtransferase
MKKTILVSLLASSLLFGFDYEREGVEVTLEDDTTYTIKREKLTNCLDINFTPEMILGGNMASEKIASNCKKSFVSALGKITPIKFSKNIDTYGELEVLEFIEKSQSNKNMLLVDSRTTEWFIQQTIPTAVNIPYTFLKKSQYPEDFEEIMELVGAVKTKTAYDFSNAKELLLFCNASWCGQSPASMRILIKMGYPEEKLKWYRGGIQSWISLNLPVIEP